MKWNVRTKWKLSNIFFKYWDRIKYLVLANIRTFVIWAQDQSYFNIKLLHVNSNPQLLKLTCMVGLTIKMKYRATCRYEAWFQLLGCLDYGSESLLLG